MTSNPQSRRLDPDLNPIQEPSPSYSWVINQINTQIRHHEIRIAISSALLGLPILSYILITLHHLSNTLP